MFHQAIRILWGVTNWENNYCTVDQLGYVHTPKYGNGYCERFVVGKMFLMPLGLWTTLRPGTLRMRKVVHNVVA